MFARSENIQKVEEIFFFFIFPFILSFLFYCALLDAATSQVFFTPASRASFSMLSENKLVRLSFEGIPEPFDAAIENETAFNLVPLSFDSTHGDKDFFGK